MKRCLWLLLASGMFLDAGSRCNAGVPASAEIDSLAWLEVQQELAAAEIMATSDDRDRLLLSRPLAGPGRAGGGRLPGSGSFNWRMAAAEDRLTGMTGLLNWRQQTLDLRVRSRKTPPEKAATRAALEVAIGGQRLHAGDLGLVHGYGLLLGHPGRSRTLDAASSLAPGSTRIVPSLGAEPEHTLQGVGAGLGRGGVRFTALGGRPAGAWDGVAASSWAVGCALSGRAARTGLLWHRQGTRQGGSLTGSLTRGAFSLGTEAALWWPADRRYPVGAWLVHLSWQSARQHRLESVLAGSTAGRANGTGDRPFLLSTWSGHGWAVRWTGRWARAVTVRALVSGNTSQIPAPGGDRGSGDLGEIQVRYRLSPRLWLAVQLRSRRQLARVRSELYPWQAPVQALKDGKTVLSGQGGWESERLACYFLVRSLESWGPAGRGRRQLFSLNASWNPAPGWALRGAWGLAWGEPEDLVSGISPLPGYVLSRHWGSWAEETMLGVAWTVGGWRWSLACSQRLPDPAPDQVPVGQAWAQIAYHW